MTVDASRRAELVRDILAAIQDEQAQQAFLSNAIAERLDVTATELEVVGTLSLHGPLTAGEIAQRTGLTSGAVTRLIDRLEQRGSVRRRPDPDDRRRVRVEMTASAQKTCELFYRPLQDEGATLLGQLSEPQLEAVLLYLRTARTLLAKHTERVAAMPVRPYLPKRMVSIKGRVLGQTIRIKI